MELFLGPPEKPRTGFKVEEIVGALLGHFDSDHGDDRTHPDRKAALVKWAQKRRRAASSARSTRIKNSQKPVAGHPQGSREAKSSGKTSESPTENSTPEMTTDSGETTRTSTRPTTPETDKLYMLHEVDLFVNQYEAAGQDMSVPDLDQAAVEWVRSGAPGFHWETTKERMAREREEKRRERMRFSEQNSD